MKAARCSLLGQRAAGRRRVENRCRSKHDTLSACEGEWCRDDRGHLVRPMRAPTCPESHRAIGLPPRHPRARDGGPFNETIGGVFL